MKKLFLGMAIATSTLAFSQSFGVKGGMNVSSLSNNINNVEIDGVGEFKSKSKIGFNGGFFMNAPLGSEFSIQPEILYNDLGSKNVFTYNTALSDFFDQKNNKIESNLNLGYISVPVMIQYNVTPEFYFEAGPQFGFLVNTNNKYKSGDISNTINLDNKNFNTFDFGLGIGAGYWISPKFGINARYNAGFTDIVKNNPGDAVKNNNFQVGLAYKFN